MSLDEWLASRWVNEHETSAQEVNDLLALIDRDLRESQLSDLSLDWSFNLAYNAALQAAKLALHVSGYRAGREAHHERTIDSLRFTLGTPDSVVRTLQRFRKKRNLAEYDKAGTISEQERDEMLALAQVLRTEVRNWLERTRPDLLP
jgi:hypothetical protein